MKACLVPARLVGAGVVPVKFAFVRPAVFQAANHTLPPGSHGLTALCQLRHLAASIAKSWAWLACRCLKCQHPQKRRSEAGDLCAEGLWRATVQSPQSLGPCLIAYCLLVGSSSLNDTSMQPGRPSLPVPTVRSRCMRCCGSLPLRLLRRGTHRKSIGLKSKQEP